MAKFVVPSLIATVLGLSVTGFTAMAQPTAAEIEKDPAIAPLPSPNAFHKRLDDATYAQRAAVLMKSFVRVPDAPAGGALIARVEEGSSGSDLGLQAGEVICELDSHPIASDAAFLVARKLGSSQSMKVWSPKNATFRTVQISPGKIGIGTGDFWSIENEYLTSLGKDAPNDDLLIAARAARTDGDLAETALARANLQTPMANLIAAAVAYYDLRLEDCLAYANTAMPELKGQDRQFAQVVLYRAALATFHWDAARKVGVDAILFNKFERANVKLLPAAIALFKTEPAEQMQSPADAFGHLASRDQTDQIENADATDGDGNASAVAATQLRTENKITFAIPDGSFNIYKLGPRGANVDFRAKVQYQPTGNSSGTFDRNFKLSLQTGDPPVEPIALTLFQFDGVAQISGPRVPVCRLNSNQFCGNGKAFDIHLVAVGGRWEVDINDHLVFYGALPVAEADRHLCVSMMVVGLTGQIDHVSWKTADARGNQ